jgi:hypothetical protein
VIIEPTSDFFSLLLILIETATAPQKKSRPEGGSRNYRILTIGLQGTGRR